MTHGFNFSSLFDFHPKFPICVKQIWMYDLFSKPMLCVQEQQRRKERKNRDEFRKLLEDHRESGTLNARLTWKDYVSKANVISLPLSVNYVSILCANWRDNSTCS